MKKLHQLLLGLIISLFLCLIWLLIAIQKIRKAIAKSVLQTSRINNDILVILDGSVNMYLIKMTDGYIAIDCGNSVKNIKTGLEELQIQPDEIQTIFLTHSDSDHTGAIELFPNAKVYLSLAEEPLVTDKEYRTISCLKLPIRNKLKCQYTTLKDAEIVTTGKRAIKCFLTPGHTPGSMCFLIDNKYLFTGDTLALKNGQTESFIKLFNMNTELEKQSIKRLKQQLSEQNVEYVFTSHFGYSSNYEQAFKDW